MKRYQIWMVKNRSTVRLMFGAGAILGYTGVLLGLGVPSGRIVLTDLLIGCLVFGWARSVRSIPLTPFVRMQEPLYILNDSCDPNPLLQETEQLLSGSNTLRMEQMILINHCVALCNLGRYQQAYEILAEINLDRSTGMSPINKLVCCNNLADICTRMNKYDEANNWYAKMMQIYADLPDNKWRRKLESLVLSAKADDLFRAGQYREAVELLDTIRAKCLCDEVSHALLYAKACLKLGDRETAGEKLRFVIEKGNRLYSVTEAKKLMEECL